MMGHKTYDSREEEDDDDDRKNDTTFAESVDTCISSRLFLSLAKMLQQPPPSSLSSLSSSSLGDQNKN